MSVLPYKYMRLLLFLMIAVIVSTLLGLGVGAVSISPGQMWSVLWSTLSGGELTGDLATRGVILTSLRLPRVLLAGLIGASLAVSGSALQGVFRNPLADPGLIGVSSGAALAVVVWIVLGVGGMVSPELGAWVSVLGVPLCAFMGALTATFIVLKLGMRGQGNDVATLILAGVALNALAGAVIGLATYMADEEELRSLTMWTLGSLGGVGWQEIILIAVCAVPGMMWLVRQASEFDLLLLGESEAYHLGMDVRTFQRRVIVVAAIVVGVGVGFTGMIGFVGLIVPHILRLLGGATHRFVMPASVLLGGSLLMFADMLARTLAAPAELPLGVITALMGAPFFIYLLRSQVGVR